VVGSFYFNLKIHGAVIGYIGTRPETLSDARSGMLKMFEGLAEKPIAPGELERARNFIIGKFLVAHQTNLKKAFYPAWFELYGLGVGFDDKYPELIRSVTEKDVRRVARKYFRDPSIVTLVPQNPSQEDKRKEKP
jgi:predicted Zn-dependent peptidase